MKIKRVKLSNYAQHKELDIKIDSNFVGIIGENGSGKSSFINSISDAITGEFHKKKSLIVSYGQKTGSILIEGEFRDQEDFLLEKYLDNTPPTLTIGGTPLVGADLISSKILELLECDKSFLSNMVFVKQEDILGILFGRPAERNKLLQRFFGLERAQKIDLALTSWMATVPETVEIDESSIKEEAIEAKKSIAEYTEKISGLSSSLTSINQYLLDNEDVIEKAELLYEKAKSCEKAKDRLVEIEAEQALLQKKSDELKSPGLDQIRIDGICHKLSLARETIASLTQLKDLLDSSRNIVSSSKNEEETCALCGSHLDDGAREKIDEKIETISAQLRTLCKEKIALVTERDEANMELSSYAEKKSLIDRRRIYVKSQLEIINGSLHGKPPKHPASVYKNAIEEYKEAQIAASNIEAKIEATNSAVSVFKGTLLRCKNALILADRVRGENDALREHKQKISRLQGLFKHNGSATEIYVNTKMKRMCSCINVYLSGFGSDYKVRVNQGNEFICQFKDKTIMSGELSGGQKVVLSLAFRFAACELFTSNTNLMILDEPTTWLDKKRIDNFGDILNQVKTMSQERNLQVFIVTHENSLTPYFDQVVKF